ncbi:hypothetical protein AVEN_166132-1 [Araneus ventricosus]|uniref:Uncharacterized protein n=1 Tax=Araneus ventricosus TaxID=182803 RepID=A0A4Y2SMS1_ARAVE|nr:hypothetical protein AVEN_166132-1 [Araneus ventricosus]
MNPNEERRMSELQNTLPRRYPFTEQKLRRQKATLSAFTLDGLRAESQHSSGWHGANLSEERMLFLIYFSFFPHSHTKWQSHWLFMGFGFGCVASTETHLVD